MKAFLIGLDTDELRALVQEEGEPSYRGSQLAHWIYRHGVRTYDDMTNLPARLRTRLAQDYEVGRSKVVATQQSRDGATKLLLEMHDGARIETVGLPYADRFSCCLSTQVGCPIGCVFCASGLGGFVRDLMPGEIVDQALTVQEMVQSGGEPADNHSHRVDHVTIMGMGEPLLNYESTLKAILLLNAELGIGMRNITVSTVGFPPGIGRLARERLQLTLAISLHAPTDELRRQLVPGMTRWSVAEIVDAGRQYVRETGRRVTFEYCLLGAVNDGEAEAHQLARLLNGVNCHVNLIPHNPVPGLAFRAPSPARARAFRDILRGAGIQTTQRVRRGVDVAAACGQLRRRSENAPG